MALLPDGPIVAVILSAFDERDFGKSADSLAAWFNVRWRKSGYSVAADVVAEVLRANGREFVRGMPEGHDPERVA